MSLAKNRMMKWRPAQPRKDGDGPPWKRKMDAEAARQAAAAEAEAARQEAAEEIAVVSTSASTDAPVVSTSASDESALVRTPDTESASDPVPDNEDAPVPDVSLLEDNAKTVILAVQAGEVDGALAALAVAEKADKNRKTVNDALDTRQSLLRALN